jgi:starch phosphorylase
MENSMKVESSKKQIAYFSRVIALGPAIPTYSGGLGILAGDALRAAAEQNSALKV